MLEAGQSRRSPAQRFTMTLGVLLLLVTTFVLYLPAGAAQASTPGGAITRSEIINRAHVWYTRGYVRNVNVYYPDPDGSGSYRSDCSGFVSMAWHLTSSPSTAYLPQYSVQIAVSQLQAGDILLAQADANHSTGHTAIFHRWANTAKTQYYGYDHGGGALSYQVYGVQRPGDTRVYRAYRYRNVSGSGNDIHQPLGYFDTATSPGAGKLRVTGWTVDPDTPKTAITVHVYLTYPSGWRNNGLAVPANLNRPDVGAAYPAYGPYHGYDRTFGVCCAGTYIVDVYAIDSSGAANDYTYIGRRSVRVG
jgi:hypothetical protein